MDGAPDPRITWAVDHMQRHLARAARDRDARRAGQPVPVAVSRTCSRPDRRRPAPYLQRLRLRRARLLIERTFLSVKEVMALVGYNDPSHFSRDFRHEHGVAPTELRRLTPSANPLTHRRIGPPRARDPGRRCA